MLKVLFLAGNQRGNCGSQVMSHSVGRKIDPKIFDVFRKNVNVILKGKVNIELSDDFDPCQPQRILPLNKIAPKIQRKDFFQKEKVQFGKVKREKGGSSS